MGHSSSFNQKTVRIQRNPKPINFDSKFVNPELKGESAEGKPTVAVPEMPLAWPTGVGFSEKHIYVNDTYNKRVLRADKTWSAESTCDVPAVDG